MKKLPGKKSGALPNKKSKAIYEDAILEVLIRETKHQITEPIDLIIYLVENYHPDFSVKKRGSPKRWTPVIQAILAVEIDNLKAKGTKSRREAAKILTSHKLLKKMKPSYSFKTEGAGTDQFEAADKSVRRNYSWVYESVKQSYQKYLDANNLKGWEQFVSTCIDLPRK
jgi:hypothetical protein